MVVFYKFIFEIILHLQHFKILKKSFQENKKKKQFLLLLYAVQGANFWHLRETCSTFSGNFFNSLGTIFCVENRSKKNVLSNLCKLKYNAS